MLRYGIAGALLALGALSAPAMAQDPGPGPAAAQPIDRVIAVVGRAALTYTQVQEEYYARLRNSNREPPTDSLVIAREMAMLVDTMIDAELLFQEALNDTTIKITPLEVTDAVDATMRQVRSQYPNETSFAAELRQAGFLGIEDYRRWLTDRQQQEMIRTAFKARLTERGLLDPIQPTEREVRAYYDAHLDQLPQRPPTRSIRQIVIAPRPDPVAKARARQLADSLVQELRAGADFATVAKRFSQDPGSAQQGGSLNWVRPGVMVREFERAAFALPLGTISDPVESVFGYHIIQVERIEATERKIRHILISAPIDSAGAAAARALADSVRALVVAGFSFDSLQGLYHDPAELRSERGVELAPPLPQPYITVLTPADSGDLTPVFELPVAMPFANKYALVMVDAAAPAGPPPFDRMREVLRQRLAADNGLEHYMAQLREKAYIDKRDL